VTAEVINEGWTVINKRPVRLLRLLSIGVGNSFCLYERGNLKIKDDDGDDVYNLI
jgi:hypothetical protein